MQELQDKDESAIKTPGFHSRLSMVIVCIAGGLLLALRAFVSHPTSYATILLVARITLSLCLTVWGCFCLSKASRLVSWTSTDLRLVLVLGWSTLISVTDVLAGGGPVVFLMAVVYASVVGWNRISRFVGLSFGGLATIFLVARLSTSIGNGNSTEEGTLILLGVTAVSVANARTIRLLIIPDRERLLSLEKENKELWNLSFRDQLTDVYNRRFAQEIGNKLVSHARRYHEQLHMFMIDIDYFKRVNDELSHAAGDEVLRSVAQKIQSHLRSSDYLARYGGEEFLVFAPLTDAEDAQFLANRIREDIASRRFDGVPWTISISIGVASLASDDTLETLVNKADKYLYSAKRGGRNRVAGY